MKTSCVECGHIGRETAKFCTECGGKMIPDCMFKLGRHNELLAVRCPKCKKYNVGITLVPAYDSGGRIEFTPSVDTKVSLDLNPFHRSLINIDKTYSIEATVTEGSTFPYFQRYVCRNCGKQFK